MKPEKRKEARRLRAEEGLSVRQITQRLGVAKSSVSLWVRDIELSEEQKASLVRGNWTSWGRLKGSRAVVEKYRTLRRKYQEEGRTKAREGDPLHLAGCMLYWAEGAKAQNELDLANSDPDMVNFFVRFLRESLHVPDNEIVVTINCYLGNGVTQEEIEAYWLSLLHLDRQNLRKTIINAQPKSSQQRGRKLRYGMCKLRVFNTQILHHIYGAIQEYAGIEKPDWLF